MDEWRYRELYEIEDQHWWFRGRRRMIWALLRRTGIDRAAQILDAGCGTGRHMVEFGSLGPVQGVDFSPDAVAFCQHRGLSGVQCAPIEQLPFPDGRFDLMLATDVIEHLDDDRRALTELRRVATPGAHLLVTVPAYQWLWSPFDDSLHHRRRYTRARLQAAMIVSGWAPQLTTYFYTAMLPAVAAVRMVKRAREGEPSDLSMVPRGLNRLLELPVRAEAEWVERGHTLPAGVSLGMVSRAVEPRARPTGVLRAA